MRRTNCICVCTRRARKLSGTEVSNRLSVKAWKTYTPPIASHPRNSTSRLSANCSIWPRRAAGILGTIGRTISRPMDRKTARAGRARYRRNPRLRRREPLIFSQEAKHQVMNPVAKDHDRREEKDGVEPVVPGKNDRRQGLVVRSHSRLDAGKAGRQSARSASRGIRNLSCIRQGAAASQRSRQRATLSGPGI